MAGRRQVVLRTHHLAHLPELKVDWSVLESRFPEGCSTSSCNATCCRAGVQVDVVERDRILAHAELVQRSMDSQQDKNPAQWFERDEVLDSDMPSGRAVGTLVRDGACVFLDGSGRCALQLASAAAAGRTIRLKPFFCYAFPLTIDDGTVVMDDDPELTQRRCCRGVPDGQLTVFDVCAAELEHVLGDDGVKELHTFASAGGGPAAVAKSPVG